MKDYFFPKAIISQLIVSIDRNRNRSKQQEVTKTFIEGDKEI